MSSVALLIAVSVSAVVPPNQCLLKRSKMINSGTTKQAFSAPLVLSGSSSLAAGLIYLGYMLVREADGPKAVPGSMVASGAVLAIVGGILLSRGRSDIVSSEQIICPTDRLD